MEGARERESGLEGEYLVSAAKTRKAVLILVARD